MKIADNFGICITEIQIDKRTRLVHWNVSPMAYVLLQHSHTKVSFITFMAG